MKHIAVIATVAFFAASSSSAVFSQTSAGSPAAMGMKAGGETKSGTRRSMHSREHADARECLRFSTNFEIIKCAEKYRYR